MECLIRLLINFILMKLLRISFVLLLSFLAFSCESDDEITKEPTSQELVAQAREFLTGDIVLSTHATMNGVNKTLLETGCPTKFMFKWNETDKNTFNISLRNFTVGAMPLKINFDCDVDIMQLNSWEKDEYKGAGWFKFYGEGGHVSSEDNAGNPSQANGSHVKGYYNVYTHEINFIINYNMMNVRSECFRQMVDKSRINHFDAEFAKYEADLKEWKEEHGLN